MAWTWAIICTPLLNSRWILTSSRELAEIEQLGYSVVLMSLQLELEHKLESARDLSRHHWPQWSCLSAATKLKVPEFDSVAKDVKA